MHTENAIGGFFVFSFWVFVIIYAYKRPLYNKKLESVFLAFLLPFVYILLKLFESPDEGSRRNTRTLDTKSKIYIIPRP